MKKKVVSLLLVAALSASLFGCGGSDAGKSGNAESSDASKYADLEAVELIGADSTGKGAAGQVFGELVSAKVAEITDGKLTIDYHPNGDLGGDEDILRQMQSNDIQLVVCQTAPTVSFIPEMAVFDMPMAFSKYDGDTIDAVLNGEESEFRKSLAAAYEKAGYHYLGILQNATYRLTTANEELNTLADFQGLQIRTMSNNNHMMFWTAIGAEPTPLAFGELFIALQNGTIDAEENAADTIVGSNFNEVQSVLACTNHILYANQICINKDAYESLDPLYQEALNQAVQEALAEMRPQLADIDADNKATLEEKGMKIITYDNSFFDEILALDAVQQLNAAIDQQANGLGTVLLESLETAQGK